MGNVTDTMTRSIKTTLQLSLALVVLLGVSAGPAMAQLTQQSNVTSTADEDGSQDPITQAELEYTTASGDPDDVIYEITSSPATSEGQLEFTSQSSTGSPPNQPLSQGSTFSQEDINDGILVYEYGQTGTREDGFNYEVNDGNDTDTDGFQFDIVDNDPIAGDDTDFDPAMEGPEDPAGSGERTYTIAAPGVLGNDSDPENASAGGLAGGDIEVDEFSFAGNPSNANFADGDAKGETPAGNSKGGPNFELTVDADGSVTLVLQGRDGPSTLGLSYQTIDSEGETNEAAFEIDVENEDPIANGDGYAVVQGGSETTNDANGLLGNDEDQRINSDDGIAVSGISSSNTSGQEPISGNNSNNTNGTDGEDAQITTDEGGTVTVEAQGAINYQAPGSGFVGEDSFDYELEDKDGGTDNATVTIEVYRQGVYVDANFSGSSNAPKGTPPNPYTSLQTAVNNASAGDDVFIAEASYNEDITVDKDLTFAGWNGESGPDLEQTIDAPDGDVVPVDVRIAGNFEVGDSGGPISATLTLDDEFTLAFQTNDVLTLVDSNPNNPGAGGSKIVTDNSNEGEEGLVDVRTPSGEFKIQIFAFAFGGINSPTAVNAAITNLRVNKDGGTVLLEQGGTVFNDPRARSRLDIGDAQQIVGGPSDIDESGRLSIESGTVDAQDTNIRLVGKTTDGSGEIIDGDVSGNDGDTGVEESPAPALNVESELVGTQALILDLYGEARFEAEGTAPLDILVQQNSAPGNANGNITDSDGNPLNAGTVLSYSEIGNGGTSVVQADTLILDGTSTVNGDLRVGGNGTATLANGLSEVTGDLSVVNGAEIEVGGSGDFSTGDVITSNAAETNQDDEFELTVGAMGESNQNGSAEFESTFPTTRGEEEESTVSTVSPKVESGPMVTALDINVSAEFGSFFINGPDAIADFAEAVNFNGDFTADGGSETRFNGVSTFFSDAELLGADTELNFEAPGTNATSTIEGDLTHGSPGTIRLADDTDNGNGSHSLALQGDLNLTNSETLEFEMENDLVDEPTTSLDFTGSSKQTVEDVDGGAAITGTDRVELDNSASPRALELDDVTLEVADLLTLTDGNFVTNGGLDMSSGLTGSNDDATDYTPVLVRRSEGQDDTGRLTDGTGNFAYTGVDADPERIEYRGSSNMATTEELLPADQDESDRNVEELAVIFEGEPIDSEGDDEVAVLTLGIDYSYSVEDVLAVRKGNLAFSAQSSLELGNRGTFIRGDGELITEEVTDPNLGLVRPGGGDGDTPGIDGFNIEYVNELTPITTGVAFNKADTSQVLDLTVNNASDDGSPARLADLSALGNSNLDDGVHVNTGYFRVNRNVEVTAGSVFDFSAQELEVNTTENIGFASFRVVNDGSIVGGDEDAEDGSLLEFIGEGKVDAFGKVNVSSSDIDDDAGKVFVFPATDVNKVDGGAGGLRRVEFQMEDANVDQADGFEFDGDFRMLAAANWSPVGLNGNVDGVDFRSISGGGSGIDRDRVDKVIVNGDFVQQGGSLLAFDEAAGINDDRNNPDTEEDSEFTVNGDFTKDAAESSRFYVGGGGGSVANFTVGTGGEENTLSQANGTFYVVVQDNFTVNGDVENESPDKWTDEGVGATFGFESEAFEVDGILDNNRGFELDSPDNTTAEITGSVLQDTTGTPVFDDETTDEIENAGTFRIEGFVDDPDNDDPEGDVSVAGDFTNAKGISEIADATEASVGGAVTVQSDSMSVNLGSGNNEVSENVPGGQQVFTTTSLTVDASGGSGGAAAKSFHDPDAVFETSTQSSVATPSDLSDEPANPEPGAFAESDTSDYVEITGATDVQSSGQLFLEGFELKQGGDFTLLGFGDRPWAENEGLSYTEDESGLLGLVRFVNDGTEPQTITTDESASTYFHGLAVNATGDVELASDVATNEASGGQGTVSSNGQATASGTLRPFGTLFLENGNLFTRDNRITILAPKPSDGEDLVEAVSADESRNGNPVDASPVLGGSNTTKVVGTMRRALAEQNEDTGGVVTDGYVYPLGKAGQENRPRYRGLVLELPSDETEPEFFTVENIPDPNEPLPDGGITSVDANDPDGTIQLDEQSLPYYRVESEDGNPNFNSFNMRVISDIGGVREVNQVRLIQRNGDWMQAGGDGAYDRNRGSEIDDDEQETTGGPNASISGFTNVVHEGVDLRDGNTIALATSSDINPNFGQFDAPGLTLASDQDAEVNAAVGEGGVDINFNVDDPDTDPANYSFSLAGGTASSIDPDNVSFQSDGTVTFVPDTENAEASFTDDESRLPLDQFEGSDPLTLEVEVEDEAGNADVASVGVNVDLQPGDADSDGNVGSASENAQDAQVALDEFLQGPDVDSPSELAPVAFNAADVGPDGGNGRVEPFDASLILSGDVGSGSSALAGKSAQGGEVVIGSVENGAIPLTLSEDASGIRSASVELSLDASVSDVSANLPSGWIIDHATKEDGTLRVGLAGTSALSSGQQIASIQLDGSAAKASTDLEPEGTYRLNGSDAKDVRVDIGPEEFALEGNYPNPFTQATTIPYQLSESADVTLEVYDMLGRKIGTLVDKQQSSGQYEVNVNQSKVGQSLSSGVYIYRLEAGDFQDTGKMTVVK
jgi:hypothetical protein